MGKVTVYQCDYCDSKYELPSQVMTINGRILDGDGTVIYHGSREKFICHKCISFKIPSGDLIDKTKIKEEEDNLGVKATYGESLPVDAEKGQLHTLTNVYPHELKKFNGNKWIDVDKDGTSAYLTNDYIKHLVDQLARNTQDVDDLSAEEKAAVSNYLTRRDVLGQ